jgi:hypothetical protein
MCCTGIHFVPWPVATSWGYPAIFSFVSLCWETANMAPLMPFYDRVRLSFALSPPCPRKAGVVTSSIYEQFRCTNFDLYHPVIPDCRHCASGFPCASGLLILPVQNLPPFPFLNLGSVCPFCSTAVRPVRLRRSPTASPGISLQFSSIKRSLAERYDVPTPP